MFSVSYLTSCAKINFYCRVTARDKSMMRSSSASDIEILKTLFDSASFPKCIELCKTELQNNPSSNIHLDYLARSYIKVQCYAESIDPLIRLFEFEPKNDSIAKQIAINYQLLGQYDDAIKWYQECIKIKPTFAPYHNNLATLYLTCGDTVRGTQLLERAIELDKCLVQPHMLLATLALSNGEFDRCINHCNHALKLNERLKGINLTLAKAYSIKNDFESSDQALKRELDINDHCIDSHILLAKNNIARERLVDAYEQLEKVIRMFPMCAYTYTLAGLVLVKLDDKEGAINFYKKAIEIDENEYRAYLNLGILYCNMGEFKRAIIALKKSLSLNISANTYTVLSQIYSEQGEDAKALEYAEQAVSANDAHAQAFCHLASLHLKASNFPHAKLFAEKSIQKNKYDPNCYLLSARIYCETREYQAAINCISNGLSELKGNHLLEGELVRIKYIKGEYDESNKDWHLDQQSEYYFDDCSGSSLVISFGSNGRISDDEDNTPLFNFRSALKPFSDFDKLYIRDLNRMYYMEGLVNCAPSISELQSLIESFMHSKQYKKVITMGASSGGFAALLYGNLIGADKIVAFNPQTVLSAEKDTLIQDSLFAVDCAQFLRSQKKDDTLYQKCLNLKNFIPFEPEAIIHYSKYSHNQIDKKYAEHIEHANCKIISHDSSTHLLALELREKNILNRLLEDFLYSN